MVNGIKLVVLDEPQQVRELEGDDASRLERDLKPADEVVDVWYVGENVAAQKKVGGLAIGHKFLRGLNAEELYDAWDLLLFPRNFGDIGGWLDAKDRDALSLEMLKEIPIVTGDFYDLAIRIKVETLYHHFAVAPRMLDPGSREA